MRCLLKENYKWVIVVVVLIFLFSLKLCICSFVTFVFVIHYRKTYEEGTNESQINI